MPSKKYESQNRKAKPKKGFTTGKILLLGALGIGTVVLAVAGSVAASRVSELSADLQVETSGRIHKIALSGITLAVDVIVKNPSRTSVTFRHPFVKLSALGKDLFSSQIDNSLYTVQNYGEKTFTIYFKTTLTSLAMLLPGLVKEYVSKKTLSLNVYAKTELTAVGGIALAEPLPYPKTDLITFGKPAKA